MLLWVREVTRPVAGAVVPRAGALLPRDGGAAAVACLYRVLRALDVPARAALGAAAFFGGSLTFWSQCNRVEVYSLHLFLVLLAVWQCLRFRATGDNRALFLACFSVGLGLAHHLTMALLVPGLLVLCGDGMDADKAFAHVLAKVMILDVCVDASLVFVPSPRHCCCLRTPYSEPQLL